MKPSYPGQPTRVSTSGTTRWSVPSWALSFAFHATVLLILAPLTVHVARGLRVEETMNVGIVVRGEPNEPAISPKPSKKDAVPSPEESVTAPLENFETPSVDPTPVAQMAPLPVLGTAGDLVREARQSLPAAPRDLGGRSQVRFFKASAVGKSFVWVIDRSASMSHYHAIDLAKGEVLEGIASLTANSQFQIVFYNTQPRLLDDGKTLLPASKSNVQSARSFLGSIDANGGTEHNSALIAALALQPEVVYFLTDADLMTDRDVANLTAQNRRHRPSATIHTIEFGNGPAIDVDKPLRRLARENDGTYGYVNVLELGKSP